MLIMMKWEVDKFMFYISLHNRDLCEKDYCESLVLFSAYKNKLFS